MIEPSPPDPRHPRVVRGCRSTIDDVARAARVSRQTVSNVIRARGRVSDSTRLRVLDAIERLEYVPHLGAASLRTRRTRQLAHSMPAIELDPGNAIAIEFIQALVTAAAVRDHHIVLTASTDASAEMEDLIRSRRIDGFIFSNLEPSDARVELVAERGVPFACFGRTDPHLPQCWVDIDNRAGIITAAQHLIAKGHRGIAFLGYSGQAFWDYERIDGYTTAMAEAGLATLPYLCANAPHAIAASIEELFAARPRPTAVIAGSDALAAALYAGAKRVGAVVGADLAVTGFDGSVIGRMLEPRLTTLAIPIKDIANLVMERFLRELDGPTGQPGQVAPLIFVHGDST